ncbi:MAG: GAF domain-containing protein, partial [Clostridiaceae bacterium]
MFGDTCIIRVLTEDKQLLNPVAFCISEKQKIFTDEIFATSVKIEGSLFEKIVSNEDPFLVSVITEQNKPELDKDLEYINVLQAKSILISPLKVQGKVIGTLGIVCSCPDKPYTDQDQVFLQTLADRVSLAISNSQLYSDNLNKLKNLSALYSAAQKVVYSLDPVEIGKDISKTCVEEFGVSFAWIGFVQDDQSLLEISHYSNYELADNSGFFSDSFREQDDLVRSAIKDYRPIIKNSNNTELNLDLKSHCSTAAFPLISRNNSFGVLFLFCEEQFFFTPEKVDFLQAYVNQAAAALENARLFEDAHRRLQHIQALRNIDMAITGSLDLRVTFNVVLDQVVTQLGVDAA